MKHMHNKVLAISLAVLMAVFLFAGTSVQAAAKTSLSQSKITLETGESTTIKVKNTGKKVSWKILSGKKNIPIKGGKKSVKITPVYNFFNKKMPHKAFCCIMNLTKTLQRIVTLYDKLIIQ